ncbi:hypothetical protein [Microcoleus sp. herbarium14]|uniref:hypothetical protein n=1 Tax=Microcoleus sp. herbarium14 TaxID=3055439 RepID=UPI002FD1FA72
MDLSAPLLPQSWQKGEGLTDINEELAEFWNGLVTDPGDLFKKYANYLARTAQRLLNKINIFGVGFGDWLRNDPIGAVAAVPATLLAGGVVLLTSGKVAGFVGGGIVKLWRIARAGLNAIGLGGLVRLAVGGVQKIWNFNFQISDSEIRSRQKSLIEGQAGIWGEALGSLVGTLCGFSLGRIAYANQAELIRFNPDLIAKLDELRINSIDESSELWEEAVQNLKSAIASSARTALNVAGLEAYLNVRKVIKAVSRGLNLSAIWPGIGKMVEDWGKEGQKPWSFASAQEEYIESLPEGAGKNFTEEFIENMQDMCAESAIQVSYAL